MKEFLSGSFITTIGGVIAALGGVVALLPKSLEVDPQWGVFAVGLGAAIAGLGAKDFNVHSTQGEVKESTEVKVAEKKKVIAELKDEVEEKK